MTSSTKNVYSISGPLALLVVVLILGPDVVRSQSDYESESVGGGQGFGLNAEITRGINNFMGVQERGGAASAGAAQGSASDFAQVPTMGDLMNFGKTSIESKGAAATSSETAGAESSSVSASSTTTTEKEVDIFKHILNPVELIKAISIKFKINFGKLVKALGKPMVFGLEAALSPFTATIKIIEKVFVPDTCRMHFICRLGANISFLKEHVPKFSPKFGDGSVLIKAFGEGMLGGDCFKKFVCESGEPKLKKEFGGLSKDTVTSI